MSAVYSVHNQDVRVRNEVCMYLVKKSSLSIVCDLVLKREGVMREYKPEPQMEGLKRGTQYIESESSTMKISRSCNPN